MYKKVDFIIKIITECPIPPLLSYEDKTRIQTFREIAFGHRTTATNFPEKGWKLAR